MPTHLDFFSKLGAPSAPLACLPTRDALCAVPVGPANATLRLFPSSRVEVPAGQSTAPSTATALGALWTAVAGGCQGVESRRALVFSHNEYDVSLCDIVHDKFEFVLYPQLGLVSWRKNDSELFFNSSLWTLLFTVAVLYLFTRVCENISQLIRRRPRAFDWHATAVTLAAAVCSVPAAAQNYFSTEERILAFVLQVYAILCTSILLVQQCLLQQSSRRLLEYFSYFSHFSSCSYTLLAVTGDDARACDDADALVHVNSVSTTGALVAVLLLLTAHMSNTFDTPFLQIFVLIFGARSFLKFLNFALLHSTSANTQPKAAFSRLLAFFIDTIAFCCVLELGVRSSAHSEMQYVSTASGLLLIAALAGVFLFCVIERNICNREI